jgi:hypothetical protein
VNRNGSININTDPTFPIYIPPAPPPIIRDGLVLELDAGDSLSYPGSGTTWSDISGNSRNFTWFSTPTFGNDGVPYFTTLGNRCTGPASNTFGINNTSGYTIFIICKQIFLGEASAFKFYSSNGSGAAGRGIFSHLAWIDNTVYFDQGGCCSLDQRISAASGGTTAWNIWGFRSSVATRNIFKNGTSIASTSTAAANINLTTTLVDLGSSDEYGGNSSTWNARLTAFLVYNRALTDAEVTQNYNAQKSRYGL